MPGGESSTVTIHIGGKCAMRQSITRMIAFGETLPALRERVTHDLALPGLPHEKVLAAVVWLLNTTAIRVGNEEYAFARMGRMV